MKRLALLASLALALPGGATAQSGAGVAANGAALYSAHCVTCHGIGGRGILSEHAPLGVLGVRGLGPSLRGVGARAADFYLRTGYMPLRDPHDQPWRKRSPFSDDQIDALVRYVASLGQGPRVPTPHPERGRVSRGLRLFTEKCAGCHQVVAEGGYVTGARVPSLDRATPTQVAEAVRIGPYLMPRFGTSEISSSELDSIVAYVEWAKHPDDRGGWALGHVGPVPEGLVAWLLAGAALVAVCVAIGRRGTA
jgi:ubiquinol-cytochrome c reductase cytochrome c subunit